MTWIQNKSWERTQAKAAAEQKVKMNEEQKGSFWASILPKLDFVEVYGQKKDEIDPQSELEALINKDGGGQVNQKLLELEIELNRAIDAQDYKKADEIQSQMKELTK